MPTLDLNTVELVSTLRTAPSKGAPSSEDYNDCQRENLYDLTSIVEFVNNTLVPLLNALPADALLPISAPVGLEGRTLVADSDDQSQLFYDSLAGRHLTVADSLRLLSGIVEGFRTRIDDMGVQVGNLRSKLASDTRNDTSRALQNMSATLAEFNTRLAAIDARLKTLEGQ